MIAAAVVTGLVVIAAGTGALGVLLAKRVVNATARPKLLRVGFAGQEVALPESAKTAAAGEYLLQLDEDLVLGAARRRGAPRSRREGAPRPRRRP